MSKTRLLPYKSALPDDVDWGGWWLDRNGVREPLPDLLPGWDYASADVVGITIEIQSASVLASTGLDSVDSVEVVAVADCPSMLRRFVTRKRLSDVEVQQVEISIELPPGEVAQKVELSAFLLLAADREASGRTATQVGSRICVGPSRTVLLEGDASRFPTEVVSFAALHLENAPWTLSTLFDDVRDSFMGSVRLMVNEDHALGRAVLANPVEPHLEARLKMEILRSLVSVVSTEDISIEDDFPQDSVGDVVDSMCRLFLNRSVHEAVQMLQQDPVKFDRILYSGVGE